MDSAELLCYFSANQDNRPAPAKPLLQLQTGFLLSGKKPLQ